MLCIFCFSSFFWQDLAIYEALLKLVALLGLMLFLSVDVIYDISFFLSATYVMTAIWYQFVF
jgi:hypothetical protein